MRDVEMGVEVLVVLGSKVAHLVDFHCPVRCAACNMPGAG